MTEQQPNQLGATEGTGSGRQGATGGSREQQRDQQREQEGASSRGSSRREQQEGAAVVSREQQEGAWLTLIVGGSSLALLRATAARMRAMTEQQPNRMRIPTTSASVMMT